MCAISICVTVVESFFASYMKNTYKMGEIQSGWAMTSAGFFYTIATLTAGILGTNKQVK